MRPRCSRQRTPRLQRCRAAMLRGCNGSWSGMPRGAAPAGRRGRTGRPVTFLIFHAVPSDWCSRHGGSHAKLKFASICSLDPLLFALGSAGCQARPVPTPLMLKRERGSGLVSRRRPPRPHVHFQCRAFRPTIAQRMLVMATAPRSSPAPTRRASTASS